MKKIGFALTSSYCTLREVIVELEKLKKHYDIIPIVSLGVIENNTRFGKGACFRKMLEEVTGNKVVSTIIEAEKFGPTEKLDLLVVAPATGNFISKLANGITDNPVTMATKATLRNSSPIVLGIATNDALGMNGVNIMKLLNTKNIYFVPFGQDDYLKKPNSLVSHFSLLEETIEEALANKQLQPVLKEYQKIKK